MLNNETSPPAQVYNIPIMQTLYSLSLLWCHTAFKYVAVILPTTYITQHYFLVLYGKLQTWGWKLPCQLAGRVGYENVTEKLEKYFLPLKWPVNFWFKKFLNFDLNNSSFALVHSDPNYDPCWAVRLDYQDSPVQS